MMDNALTSQYKGVVSLVDHKGKEPARCLDIGTGVRSFPSPPLYRTHAQGWAAAPANRARTHSGPPCSADGDPVGANELICTRDPVGRRSALANR